MKRPLCLFVISFAIVSFFIQIIRTSPLPGAAFEQPSEPAFEQLSGLSEGDCVYLTGRLYKKEIKNNRLIYYLKDISVPETDRTSIQKQIPTQNEIGKDKKQGVICYMEEEAFMANSASAYLTGQSASEYSASARFAEHPVGRWLYVRGRVMETGPAENEGQFDAARYYGSIGYGVRLWGVEVLAAGVSEDSFGENLVDIKRTTSERFLRYMKPEHAGIMNAMLLGDKTSLDTEIKNLYQKNGIAHILAISGLHISLLGMMGYRFLRRLYLPPRCCSLLGIFFVLVYIKMIGLGVSSFRAVCMFVLYMLADVINRTYDLKTALALSALLLIAEDPAVMQQAGFLLSYLAVLALAIVNPVLQAEGKKRAEFERLRRRRRGHPLYEFGRKFFAALRSNLLSGFSVQVLIFPITLWFYFEFPIYSFLLNLIVIPCMSVVLLSGFIGALPLPGCGYVLRIADTVLSFYEWICTGAQQLPGAMIVTGRPEIWQMLVYYGAVMGWLAWEARGRCKRPQDFRRGCNHSQDFWGRGKRPHNFRRRGISTGERRFFLPRFLVPLLCMLVFLVPVHRENRMDMLSVGQGDCVCVRDFKGNVVLVDGGSTDVSDVGKYRLLPYLKYHGISEIDAVFLSHAHADHYSAICELLALGRSEGFRIRTLCLSGYAAEELSALAESPARENPYAEIISLARRAGCEVVYLGAGDAVSCGEMEFTVVYPENPAGDADREEENPAGGDAGVAKPETNRTSEDENDRSMVLLGRLGGCSVLFTGDISFACDSQVIRCLQEMGVTKINCLKVAHHGAQTSTSAELLEAFAFDVALISCGKDNAYGHPHEALLGRLRGAGCRSFVTAQHGQISVRIGKKRRDELRISVTFK